MPRLNTGTLLENLVVLEVTRVLASRPDTSCEFATAFAMPPLTQWWHKSDSELQMNPRLNASVIQRLLAGQLPVGAPTSLPALLRASLSNAPSLPVVPYAQTDATQRLPFGGPNGALLAAMLREHYGQPLRLWCNDLPGAGRYRDDAHEAATECPRTSRLAQALVHGAPSAPNLDAFSGQPFPQSVAEFSAWRRPCSVRIGFLDPDTYTAGGAPGLGQVDSNDHVLWLTNLHVDAASTAGVTFFANHNGPGRPALISAFHEDARADFPRSVVFQHDFFMVGVKLRAPDGDAVLATIQGNVMDAWAAWCTAVGRGADGLTCWVDGQRPG